jgi:hypothetical protein
MSEYYFQLYGGSLNGNNELVHDFKAEYTYYQEQYP